MYYKNAVIERDALRKDNDLFKNRIDSANFKIEEFAESSEFWSPLSMFAANEIRELKV